MPRLSPVSWSSLVRRLRKLGFQGPYWGGKHPFMIKGEIVLTIPNDHNKDIGIGFLHRILRQGGISRAEWMVASKGA